jgi:hypothetical protein
MTLNLERDLKKLRGGLEKQAVPHSKDCAKTVSARHIASQITLQIPNPRQKYDILKYVFQSLQACN